MGFGGSRLVFWGSRLGFWGHGWGLGGYDRGVGGHGWSLGGHSWGLGGHGWGIEGHGWGLRGHSWGLGGHGQGFGGSRLGSWRPQLGFWGSRLDLGGCPGPCPQPGLEMMRKDPTVTGGGRNSTKRLFAKHQQGGTPSRHLPIQKYNKNLSSATTKYHPPCPASPHPSHHPGCQPERLPVFVFWVEKSPSPVAGVCRGGRESKRRAAKDFWVGLGGGVVAEGPHFPHW